MLSTKQNEEEKEDICRAYEENNTNREQLNKFPELINMHNGQTSLD